MQLSNLDIEILENERDSKDSSQKSPSRSLKRRNTQAPSPKRINTLRLNKFKSLLVQPSPSIDESQDGDDKFFLGMNTGDKE